MKNFFLFVITTIIFSCYGINEKTSVISVINRTCSNSEVWRQILNTYTLDTIVHPELVSKLQEIRNEPFSTEVLYFKDYPEELIVISDNYFFIRYVYNKKISNQVLDGLSPQLKDGERNRIKRRIDSILELYKCYENK